VGERFGPLVEEELENPQRFSAGELVAQYASFSSIGGLPPDRRDAALAALRGVRERHGVHEASLVYRTVVVTAARRGGRPAGGMAPTNVNGGW
jgi:hypothetical protein